MELKIPDHGSLGCCELKGNCQALKECVRTGLHEGGSVSSGFVNI